VQIVPEASFDPAGPSLDDEQREDVAHPLSAPDGLTVNSISHVFRESHLETSLVHDDDFPLALKGLLALSGSHGWGV